MRMADGRLFTDYRRSTALLPPLQDTPWADWNRIQSMQRLGVARMQNNRAQSNMAAGSTNCVDTMVPELSKWNYDWNNGQQRLRYPVGIGAGRNPLPGTNMSSADLAIAAFPLSMLHGAYDTTDINTSVHRIVTDRAAVPLQYNKYSLPYGNA